MVKDGKTGMICQSRNPIDLAHCLAKLIENPELRIQMGEAGYQYFKSEFTIDKFIERLINVLNRVLEEMPERKPKKIY